MNYLICYNNNKIYRYVYIFVTLKKNVKRLFNLDQFINILPYSSEIFGIYQPLIGWRGERSKNRAGEGTSKGYNLFLQDMVSNVQGDYSLKFSPQDHGIEIQNIKPAKLDSGQRFGSMVMDAIAKKIPPLHKYDDSIWESVLESDIVNTILNTEVKVKATRLYEELSALGDNSTDTKNAEQVLRTLLDHESATAGVLLQFAKERAYEPLKSIFYRNFTSTALEKMKYLKYQDPFERIKLTEEGLKKVVLSPVGIAHLFRQYFYEFDTFLGPTVGHVWVSPYTSVELMEVSTRKNTIERTLEREIETLAKSEKSITDQDEISEAIKDENRKDTKLGATVTANQNWVWGSATETGSFSLETTQQQAREQTHKHMRQQSEKLSTELKENVKTTFKVVTETTELSSKRYLLNNQSAELRNFELRRKMRHVGVQVQDIGTYLCWQTYVDDAGKDLGLANLVHIASPADLQSDPDPSLIPQPMPFQGETFTDAIWLMVDQAGSYTWRNYPINPPKPDFVFDKAEVVRTSGSLWEVTYEHGDTKIIPDGEGGSEEIITSINIIIPAGDDGKIDGTAYLNYKGTIYYKPSKALLARVAAKNEDTKREAANAKEVRSFKEQYIKAVRERIKLASKIESRRYEDLREEERIIIYRRLIQSLMAPSENITNPDDRTRHIVAELLNSIFDIEKMLYFVAPEWWTPRLHASQLSMGSEQPGATTDKDGKIIMNPTDRTPISDENIVGWGGREERRKDDYYITEDSVAAKFGSSLGWLMQLDGDNMRNAFLNSPWVKAVIPIRPGKEEAALNWLKQVEVEGNDGIDDGDVYTGPDKEFQGKNPATEQPYTLIEVLKILAGKIADKHSASITVDSFPNGVPDAKNTVASTPVDWVYEHGFYPLVGGFRAGVRTKKEDQYPFEVFDQWIEVVPTDQIVAVEVKYDPKTGRQL